MSDLEVGLFNFVVILFLVTLLSVGKIAPLPETQTSIEANTYTFKLTDPKDDPYAVLVMGEHDLTPVGLCSGALLSSGWVLTAGSCVKGKGDKSFMIYAGGNHSWQEQIDPKRPSSTKSQIRASFKVFISSQDDLALVLLRQSFQITEYVSPVLISKKPWIDNEERNCKATGFGVVQIGKSNLEVDNVRKTHLLQTMTPCKCHEKLGWQISSRKKNVFSCTLPKMDNGLCSGDSGAGLICNNLLQGIATSITKAKDLESCDFSTEGNEDNFVCGDKNSLTIFTLVHPYVSWINHTMSTNQPPEMASSENGAKSVKECSTLLIILISLINSFC